MQWVGFAMRRRGPRTREMLIKRNEMEISPVRTTLHFETTDSLGEHALEVPVTDLVIAGWTGSDAAAIEAHILELEALGVRRPKKTPIFYRGAATLLTQRESIEVVGSTASGEVEPVIFSTERGLWLGIGSDHTDREVETVGITISKQMCAKPVSTKVWAFEEVAGHWNELIVRSWMTKGGERRLYQEGPLAKIRHPRTSQTLWRRWLRSRARAGHVLWNAGCARQLGARREVRNGVGRPCAPAPPESFLSCD